MHIEWAGKLGTCSSHIMVNNSYCIIRVVIIHIHQYFMKKIKMVALKPMVNIYIYIFQTIYKTKRELRNFHFVKGTITGYEGDVPVAVILHDHLLRILCMLTLAGSI